MAIVGLLKHGAPEDFYRGMIAYFASWCTSNHLILNTGKTKEMVFDFGRNLSFITPVCINNECIEQVTSFKYLGTFYSNNLKWQTNTAYLYKKLKESLLRFL